MTNPTHLLQAPDTVALLLGALREYFKHMPEHERAGSYDLFDLLRQLGNDEELAHRAFEAIDGSLMKVHVKGDEADIQEFMNRASYASMLRVITRAHHEETYAAKIRERAAALRAQHIVTVLDLAIHRGAKPNADGPSAGSYSAEAIMATGLPVLGGCARCGATIAAYNAAPTTEGHIMCVSGCAEGVGYATVEEANFALFGVSKNPTARELRDRLFQVQEQDVPLTDEQLAALVGR